MSVSEQQHAAQKEAAVATHSQQADEFAQSYEELDHDPYQTCFTYSRHRLDAWLERLVPGDGNGRRALDVGCGTGHQMAWLAGRGFETVGVDGSPEMLDHARERNPQAEIRLADVERLPFEDASFDLILCIEVLRYLPDMEACVSEMARVLKPGGTCLATAAPLFSLNGYPIVNRIATAVPVGELVRLRQYFTTVRRLRRVFEAAGFPRPEVHGVYSGPVNWVQHLAPNRLHDFLRAWEPRDQRLADRPVLRGLSNMLLVNAIRC
jgi:ubiquinone/menaquinone biosynthesis C-methylase UbiE